MRLSMCLCNRAYLGRVNYNCVSLWYDDNSYNTKIVIEIIIMVIAIIEIIASKNDHDWG